MDKTDSKVMIFCSVLVCICLIMISIIHNIQVKKLMDDNSTLKEQNEALKNQNSELYKIIYEYNFDTPTTKDR